MNSEKPLQKGDPDDNWFEKRPMLLCELAELYKVTPKTMRKWIRLIPFRLGKRYGRHYTNRQVGIIFQHLGKPGWIRLDDEALDWSNGNE